MVSNFEKSDFKSVINLVSKKNPILTQGKNVKKFEYLWSKWLGVKYSVFVNSGSSANFLTFASLDIYFKNRKYNDVIVPAFTWISDIVSLIKNNFNPVFVDIDKKNLSLNLDQVKSKINKKTFGIFITHAQGFNGFNDEIIKIAKNKKIHIIEDVCESHGANFKNKKLGTYGLISNFSFYYAHHLSTIEGGMICTNNKNIYHIIRSLRSHGMARELGDFSLEKKYISQNKQLSPKFIFLYPGFNFRNNEIGACIGINQLKRLDSQNKKRAENLSFFLKNLDKKKYWNNFDLEGNSNYAFPLILYKKSIKNRDKLERILKRNGIEFRRGNVGGGNQLRQPYLKKLIKINPSKFTVTDHIHFYGYYIGNYPSLKEKKIINLCKILNSL
jgi:CDP-6-deoxy-D-xylo-4-hexulose-3-dehydrase